MDRSFSGFTSSLARLGGLVLFLTLALAPASRADELPAGTTEACAVVPAQDGTASWHAGTGRTACGERWKSGELMAAHRSLPLGSRVRVTDLKNGLTTVVRITDRGPYSQGRIIDLSPAAAREIGLLDSGIGKVRLEVLPADS